MTPIVRTVDLDELRLESGAHRAPDQGMCLLEAVSYVAGEPFSDRPACVSPVLAAFGRSWNDGLDDEERQMLRPYVLRLVDTLASKKVEERRAWMATDWLVRFCTPQFLRLTPSLVIHAEQLEALPELTSSSAAAKAQPKISAAWAAAGAAAWASAGAAARAAARAALRPTVLVCQGAARVLFDRMIEAA